MSLDLSADKPVAGTTAQAAKITDAFTQIENFVNPLVSGRLLKRTVITNKATTSITLDSRTKTLYVECIGAGGGGAGAPSSGTTAQASGGSPGGAGGYANALITSNVNSGGAHTTQVGTGGNGATAGNTDGTAGTASFFKDSTNTIVCNANGGTAGLGQITAGTVAAHTIGGNTGAGTIGDIVVPGVGMQHGTVERFGGVNILYRGPAPPVYGSGFNIGSIRAGGGGSNGGGGSTLGPGYGGGGGLDTNVTARTGGAGADGMVVVWEFA